MKSAFSTKWKSSVQIRKQRKYRHNAPLHTRQKFVSSHLSKELRKKYNKRSIQIRTGDKVKVLRGSRKGKSGKVERVDLTNARIFIEGFEITKREGSKVKISIDPSNLLITELSLDDKKRIQNVEGKKGQGKNGKKATDVKGKSPEKPKTTKINPKAEAKASVKENIKSEKKIEEKPKSTIQKK